MVQNAIQILFLWMWNKVKFQQTELIIQTISIITYTFKLQVNKGSHKSQ